MTTPFALIIEDDQQLANVFSLTLKQAGWQTEIISTGDIAQTRLTEIIPTLIILDIHLPQISGEVLLQQIRHDKRLVDTLILLVTADAFKAEKLRDEVDIFVLKPIRMSELRDLVSNLFPKVEPSSLAKNLSSPTLTEIQTTRRKIDPFIVQTPVWLWRNREIVEVLGPQTEVFLKLELFQHTGTFKPRGALNVMLNLDQAALSRGVTTVSAGNHAIAVAYAAQQMKTSAKVVMISQANPARIAQCRAYGAEIELSDTAHTAFERVHQIEAEEGRTFVHPFEGPLTTLGTATVGLELCQQVPDLEAVIVPIGGGGLCAGIATAVKLMQPQCQVFGVEPEGADSMHRSFAAGKPQSIDQVKTIADSLGAPYAAPYSFGLCQRYVDDLVRITDDQMRRAMALIFQGVKLAVEPAGAAATAALCGPLRERLSGKQVGVIVCGSNIDVAGFAAEIGTLEEKK